MNLTKLYNERAGLQTFYFMSDLQDHSSSISLAKQMFSVKISFNNFILFVHNTLV